MASLKPSSSFSYHDWCCFRWKYKMGANLPPEDVQQVFDKYAVNGVMGVDEVQRFLKDVQGHVGATKEDAQAVLDSLIELKHLGVLLRKGLNLDAFFRYLFSDHNLAVSISDKVNQDMDAPLSHYYIYTGHNSYLTGNQWNSKCSDIPIKEALLKGVRVIELDLWPNPAGDDIQIIHGGTLTSPVNLIRCLNTIKEYAFKVSPYPVIITLEDHLTPDLREKLANTITQTFQSMLFYPDERSIRMLPSPSDLREKIMISTKPPQKKNALENKGDIAETLKKDTNKKKKKDLLKEEPWGQEIPPIKPNADGETDHDQEDEEPDDSIQTQTPSEYHSLIAIQGGRGKGPTKVSLIDDPDKVKRISMSEQKLEKAATKYATDIVRFTQRNFLRVFPKGTRFDSSNYNPLIGWMHGAQMVAFNMQGHGRPLWLMQGMFRANGGCGYIKKPNFLLNSDQEYDPKTEKNIKKILKVKVFMGDGWRYDFGHNYFDCCSPPDFYTKVGITGVPADDYPMERTETVENTWIPMWNKEYTFELRVPELAFLRIEVHEEDIVAKTDDFGGQTCLPVSEIRPGIRAVPLYDRKGVKYKNVKLLVRFDVIITTN